MSKWKQLLPSDDDIEATFCTFQPIENPEIARNLVQQITWLVRIIRWLFSVT